MDVKKIFRGISERLLNEFSSSAEIKHLGTRGAFRETTLRDFLEQGRLPKKYAIGSGEIVGPEAQTSKQSDLIIYDSLSGISLIYSDIVQVYPIESVYGIIEVKSSLSKTELLAALENIRSVKLAAPNEGFEQYMPGGIKVIASRPKPFGLVFAYQLSDNSLDSLQKNLSEWESANTAESWPNAIVVLNEGIIYHIGRKLERCFRNGNINASTSPTAIYFRKDSLFHFYSILLELCTSTVLGPVRLERYFNPPEKIGRHIVRNHDRFLRKGDDAVRKLTEDFIEKL